MQNISAISQVCFPTEDGQWLVCNAVRRNGQLIVAKSGKWFKFRAYQKRKKSSAETLKDALSASPTLS